MAIQQKSELSPFEEVRNSVLERLRKFWADALEPPTSHVLHEVMFFDDLPAVRSNIIGTPRLAVHTALNDPHHYLRCTCCQLSDQSDILPSLPDISIVYKLHLESGRHINLYDWLQVRYLSRNLLRSRNTVILKILSIGSKDFICSSETLPCWSG